MDRHRATRTHSLYTNRYKHTRPLCPHIFSHSCFSLPVFLSLSCKLSAYKQQLSLSLSLSHTHTLIWMLCVCAGRCLHAKWNTGWMACSVWVCVCVCVCVCECVLSTLCVVSLKLLSVLLRQLVTGLSLPVFLYVSLPVSLSLTFLPLYISSLSFHFSLPIPPSLFLQLCFSISSLSYLLPSAVARTHPYKSFNPVLSLKISFFFNRVEKFVNGKIIPLVSNANQFVSRIFLHSSATLESSMREVRWSAFSCVSWQGFYFEDIHD